MNFGDEVLIRIGGGKGHHYDGLKKFLQAASQGFPWLYSEPMNLRVFMEDSSLPAWPEDRVQRLRETLDEILAWPLPGSVAAVHTAWAGWDDEHYDPEDSDYYDDAYRKSTPASRRAFVDAAMRLTQERTA